MANREVYPSSLFPLRGDVSAEAGAVSVKVIGIQGTPITVSPTVLINGSMVSTDYLNLINTALTVNDSSDGFLGNRVNGVLIS